MFEKKGCYHYFISLYRDNFRIFVRWFNYCINEWAGKAHFLLLFISMKILIPESVHTMIQEICTQQGAYVLELSTKGSKTRPVLEIVIDTEHGVMHEMCRNISKKLDEFIETNEFLSGLSGIEVSSPGIDRPLEFQWQYTKHIGRDLRIALKAGGHVEGTLMSLQPELLVLHKKHGKQSKRSEPEDLESVIQFADINHSIVQLRWK